MSETLNLTDLLFRHKTSQNAEMVDGDPIGMVYHPESDDLFSPARSSRARKEIKTSGATKLYDHLFDSAEASIYPASDDSTVYGEFKVDEETGTTVRYHFIADSMGNVRFAEPELGCRYHKLLPFLAKAILENDTHMKDIVTGIHDKDHALMFTDHLYYAYKNFEIEAETGDSSVILEAKRGFGSGLYQNYTRIGDLESEFEDADFTEETSVEEPEKDDDVADFFEEIKEGKHIIDYDWDDEVKPYMVPLSFLDGFVPSRGFIARFKAIESDVLSALERINSGDSEASEDDVINVLYMGKPGTGKTYEINAILAGLGIPGAPTMVSENTEEDAFSVVSKVVEGKLTEIETSNFLFHRFGGGAINEEINLGKPATIQGSLGQRLVYPFLAEGKECKQYKRHALCLQFATMNIGIAGTKELNDALYSRYSKVVLEDPKESDFIDRLMKVKGATLSVCQWVYRMYTRLIDTLKDPEFNGEDYIPTLTFRDCQAAIRKNVKTGTPLKECINDTLIAALYGKDPEIARSLQESVVDTTPDYMVP